MMPVLDRIRARFPAGSSILELGCGAGLHASLLAAWGYRVTAGDNDPRVLEMARETIAALGQEVELGELDATALPSEPSDYDLVFSLGLMEHFDRPVTIDLLRAHGRIARWVMAVVPTKHTRFAAEITDERIYPRAEWESMFREAGLPPRECFVFGDLPTLPSALWRRILGPPAYRVLQKRFGYGMNICVFGAPDGRRMFSPSVDG